MGLKGGAHQGMFCSRQRLCLAVFGALVLAAVVGVVTYFVTKDRTITDCPTSPEPPQGPDTPPWGDKEPYSFDDWYDGHARYRGYSLQWIEGEEAYLRRVNGSLYKYTITSGTPVKLVDKAVFDAAGSGTYFLSKDLKYMLFAYERKTKWRYSYDAKYRIYTIGSTDINFIEFPNDNTIRGQPLEICRWSNNDKLAFVYKNNLYYQESPTGGVFQVSTEGSVENNIFVGHSDWLYEEELIYTPQAHWWSPDSRFLLYAVFDDSHLNSISFPWYGEASDVYGKNKDIAYPKPGDLLTGGTQEGKTSSMKLRLYDTQTTTQGSDIKPPAELANKDHYITSVKWSNNSHVLITWTNRIQSRIMHTVTDVTIGGLGTTSYTHEETVGWNDPKPDLIRFSNNGQKYVDIISNSGWKQVAVFTTDASLQDPTFLTSGLMEVKGIVAVDQDMDVIYYYATNGDRRDRHLFRVGTPDADQEFQPLMCMTCDLAPTCKYVSASFSSAAKTYLLTCNGPEVPWVELRQASDNSLVRVVESNQVFKDTIKGKAMPSIDYKSFPVGGGHTGQAVVFVPPNVNKDSKKTHPLLIHVYAGPGSQYVTSRYSLGWQTYLAGSEGVVYARIDGRGSASNGDAIRFLLKRKLGTIEIEDQLLGAKWLAENLPYVDPSKVAIWGGSYGGFSTLHSLTETTHKTFQCGIAVAPVTDFRYYDTAYTERFMGLATSGDNEAGYNDTDVLRKVDQIGDRKLLLVHGTADDNVHFLHSAKLMKALNSANIQYDLAVAPDKTHYTVGTRQLYNKYTNFLLNDCWNQTRRSM